MLKISLISRLLISPNFTEEVEKINLENLQIESPSFTEEDFLGQIPAIYTENTLKILNESDIDYFYLVSLGNDFNFTSNIDSITMSNGITYSSDSSIISTDPQRISTTVDRTVYRISFSDPNFELRPYFEKGAVGDKLEVRIGFFNTFNKKINSIDPGFPFTDINDTLLLYKGVVDSQKYEINFEEDSVIATVEGSSPMASLDLVKPFYTSKESMRSKYPNDSSFDKNLEGAGEIELKWGKA